MILQLNILKAHSLALNLMVSNKHKNPNKKNAGYMEGRKREFKPQRQNRRVWFKFEERNVVRSMQGVLVRSIPNAISLYRIKKRHRPIIYTI